MIYDLRQMGIILGFLQSIYCEGKFSFLRNININYQSPLPARKFIVRFSPALQLPSNEAKVISIADAIKNIRGKTFSESPNNLQRNETFLCQVNTEVINSTKTIKFSQQTFQLSGSSSVESTGSTGNTLDIMKLTLTPLTPASIIDPFHAGKALLCQKDKEKGKKCPLQGTSVALSCVFLA